MTTRLGLVLFICDGDGNEDTIEFDGVAAHPGDLGMKYYVEKVIELIK